MSYMKDGMQLNFDRLQSNNNVTLAAVKVLIKRVYELEERLLALETDRRF